MRAYPAWGTGEPGARRGQKNETYITFNQVYGSYVRYRSNQPGRVRYQVQVHVFQPPGRRYPPRPHAPGHQALATAGIAIISWGPDEFEDETGYNHIAITTELREPIERRKPRERIF